MTENNKSRSSDKIEIDRITASFFEVFTNIGHNQPDWSMIYQLCIPETLILKINEETVLTYNLDRFIEPRKKILSDGTLTNFMEQEIMETTHIAGHLAHRFSRFQKKGSLNGTDFQETGNKFFQFIKTNLGWRINAVSWEDDIKE